MPHAEYASFAELATAHDEGKDYDRLICHVPDAAFVLVAPHGGRIEPETDTVAEVIAANAFSFYCFRSHLRKQQANLHITSHCFDDPICLDLVAKHRTAVSVHGWGASGERVVVGGMDTVLSRLILTALREAGFSVKMATASLSGANSMNICNRGNSGRGVQLEMTMALRKGPNRDLFAETVRRVLLANRNALQA